MFWPFRSSEPEPEHSSPEESPFESPISAPLSSNKRSYSDDSGLEELEYPEDSEADLMAQLEEEYGVEEVIHSSSPKRPRISEPSEPVRGHATAKKAIRPNTSSPAVSRARRASYPGAKPLDEEDLHERGAPQSMDWGSPTIGHSAAGPSRSSGGFKPTLSSRSGTFPVRPAHLPPAKPSRPSTSSTGYGPAAPREPPATPSDRTLSATPRTPPSRASVAGRMRKSPGTPTPAPTRGFFERSPVTQSIPPSRARAEGAIQELLGTPIPAPTRGIVEPIPAQQTQRKLPPMLPMTFSQIKGKTAKELGEPPYVESDAEIRDALWKLMNEMEEFATKYFSYSKPAVIEKLDDILADVDDCTQRIIGCVAGGGPGGVHGWRELFLDSDKRQALACGIIGNVIVEQVFRCLFFGGTLEQRANQVDIQNEEYNQDGFERSMMYSEYIELQLQDPKKQDNYLLPANFTHHTAEVVTRLYTVLEPLIKLAPDYIDPETGNKGAEKQILAIVTDLWDLVGTAGLLSLSMRMNHETVYYFPPTAKDERYDHKSMECFNEEEMRETHPRDRTTWPRDITEAEKRRARGDEPLIRIICLQGCTAYRQGGWKDVDGKHIEGADDKGIRSRVLTQAWVYCRWGRPRRWNQGIADDREETHGVQWKGGFWEFRNVVEYLKREKYPEYKKGKEEEYRKEQEVTGKKRKATAAPASGETRSPQRTTRRTRLSKGSHRE